MILVKSINADQNCVCCCLNTTVVVGWQIGAVATMGLFDKLANMLKMKKEQINILVVGLNNSGKSTIVNHFKNPNERTSIVVPTVGFSVERFESEYQLLTLKCSTFLIISPTIHETIAPLLSGSMIR